MHRYTVDARVPFVGRDHELQRLAASLEAKACVTLVGPGGVGKSRLALEAAERWARRSGGKSLFISLVGVVPEEVAGTVALALGVPEEPGRSLLDLLADAKLSPQQTIILDNCEDAPAAVREVVERLHKHERLAILATSRVRLGATGETVFAVPPFDELDGSNFFVARARVANVAVDAQSSDGDSIRNIVKRLDGLAVAIDLAAARLASLSVQELAVELADPRPYHFRSSASREPRHWTLNHVVDWSLAKLDREALRIFTLGGRFTNVFTASDIAALGSDNAREPTALLEHLADQSLILRVEGKPTYAMLAPIRAVAKRNLSQARDRREIDQRFARYMDEIGSKLRARSETAEGGDVINVVTERYDDFISVIDWALQAPADRLATALNVFGSLVSVWADGGRFTEGLYWCDRFVAAAGVLDQIQRGRLYYNTVRVAYSACEYERILQSGPLLISTFTIANDRLGLARAYNGLGVAWLATGHTDEAKTHIDTALALYESVGHETGIASALLNQGNIALDGYNEPVTARECYVRALEWAVRAGSKTMTALAQGNLAEAASDPTDAEHWARLALEGFTRAGDEARSAWAHQSLARAALARNDYAGAARELVTALDLLQRQFNAEYAARCVETAARLLVHEQKPQLAATLLLAARRLRLQRHIPALGNTLRDASNAMARIESSLTGDQIAQATEEADAIEFNDLLGITRRALTEV